MTQGYIGRVQIIMVRKLNMVQLASTKFYTFFASFCPLICIVSALDSLEPKEIGLSHQYRASLCTLTRFYTIVSFILKSLTLTGVFQIQSWANPLHKFSRLRVRILKVKVPLLRLYIAHLLSIFWILHSETLEDWHNHKRILITDFLLSARQWKGLLVT